MVQPESTMKRMLYGSLLAMALAAGAHAASPTESVDGQRLYEANCTGCHDASVHTRPNRQIRSLDALKQQLEQCGHASKKDLSAGEAQAIVKYLNDRYYHFQ
jgi:cytochrome c5